MKYSALIATAILIASVTAECPNACSGHGRCTNYAAKFASYPTQTIKIGTGISMNADGYGYDEGEPKKDSCTCFTHKGFDGSTVYAWTGADCSLRTCPFGIAHADTPDSTTSHATELECSGKGTCDRKTGECKCFPGYSGLGCVRTTCPNDCSGNGQCLPLKKIAADVAALDSSLHYSTSSVKYDSAFDALKQYACSCDTGRAGADCSIQLCPSSADPMGGNGSEKGRPCSGRGLCENGACKCFTGFFGTDCSQQRSKTG